MPGYCGYFSSRFLSTPSARRATATVFASSAVKTYFYPRPPRGGRLDIFLVVGLAEVISIHALREEGDPMLPRV